MTFCSDCGHSAGKWFGRCPECGSWNTAQATAEALGADVLTLAAATTSTARLATGIGELDRVLGGGFVPGGVVLIAGEPGIGKSTLVLQAIEALRGSGRSCLFVSGEESPAQVALRAARLGVPLEQTRAAFSSSLAEVLALATEHAPEVLVIDSIQTLADRDLSNAPGSVVQVTACTVALVAAAKNRSMVVLLVGHVTKSGDVAGPKTLEHVVDAVLTLEGERSGTLRILRSTKNRFGSSDETGVFEMRESGLGEVEDPSALLLADRALGVAGSIAFPALEGSRVVTLELQSLVNAAGPTPRRVAIGIDARRLDLLVGVIAQHARIELASKEVFAAAAGGVPVKEPAADLGIALAIVSAASGGPIASGTVAIGEVGLTGEIRRVPGLRKRLAEAARMGFDTALVPSGCEATQTSMSVVPVRNIVDAIALSGLESKALKAV